MTQPQVQHFRPFAGQEQEYQAASVDDVVERRVRQAPREIIIQKFGRKPVKYKLWIFDKFALLNIGENKGLMDASIRQRDFGNPFPDLVSTAGETGIFSIDSRNITFAHLTLTAAAGVPRINLKPDASVTMINMRVSFAEGFNPYPEYTISTLFMTSFGILIKRDNFSEFMDDLISKYLNKQHLNIAPNAQ